MGRFRFVEGDDDDDPDHWEFVGSSATEQSALVERVTSTNHREQQEFCSDPRSSSSHHNPLSASNQDDFRQPTCFVIHHFPEESSSRPRRRNCGLYVSLLILLVALFWQDPPPAPPPSNKQDAAQNDNWRLYIEFHTRQAMESTKALCMDTPYHIFSWFLLSCRTNVELFWERLFKAHISDCKLPRVPLDLEEQLRNKLVGQDLAVEWLSDRLQATLWTDTNNDSPQQQPRQPLVVLATGYESTGKRFMAQALRNALFAASPSVCRESMELKGRDYSPALSSKGTLTRLVESVSSLCHRRPSGALIVLSHVEMMEERVLSQFLQLLREEDDDTPIGTNAVDATHALHQTCQHSILYLTTTSIGVAAVTRSLRKTKGHLAGDVSLSADLRDAVQEQLGLERSAFHVILPFAPFTKETLHLLLDQRVNEFQQALQSSHPPVGCCRRLVVTDAARSLFLDASRVEYLTWRSSKAMTKQSDDNILMIISLDGARILDTNAPLLTKLHAQVHQVVRSDPRPDKVLVVDVAVEKDDSSSSTVGVVVQWCADDHHGFSHCETVSEFQM